MSAKDRSVDKNDVPVIDLCGPQGNKALVEEIANACSTFGFFQVTNHGIPAELVHEFRQQMKYYFAQSYDQKIHDKRSESNARGYFDDELTKQRRDWKEALDVGVPGSRSWDVPDDHQDNACLDGFNRFPDCNQLPDFRTTIVTYFEACAKLSDRLAILMARGLRHTQNNHNAADSIGEGNDTYDTETHAHAFLESLRTQHTSYLRMNYYPCCPSSEAMTATEMEGEHPLGISPHTDAGFLTVLAQDDECHSLQVSRHTHTNNGDQWITVKPVPGALTINTGDMAMLWSNGKYRAPLHRVLTDPVKVRYSAPFFYNPGYSTRVEPLLPSALGPSAKIGQNELECRAIYSFCLWGYFRAVRFAGDLTDLGVEIQISNFSTDSCDSNGEHEESMNHPEKQDIFAKEVNFHEPFSVEKFRPLLQGTST